MHEEYLLAALEIAKLGRGICAPNPCVGAVAVKNNTIIGRAWHRGAGTPHAEQLLIEQLPTNVSDVTLYVTLEPCNHQGRTPPCVDAIVNYGFQTVVFAYRDPNPIVAKNNSSQQLESKGVKVIHHPLAEIDAFYESYAYWTRTGKPWVTAKIAQSFDGKIAGTNGERVFLSNDACHEFTHQNRLISDIILTTAQTILQDMPQFNVRLPDLVQEKTLAIIDRQLKLTTFPPAKHCHIFYDEALDPPLNTEHCTYYPVPCNEKKLNLASVIQFLGNLGFHSVWVEAGGKLFTSMHLLQLVQRTYIYLVPSLLGEKATPAYQCSEVLEGAKQMTWTAMENNMRVTLDWEQQC